MKGVTRSKRDFLGGVRCSYILLSADFHWKLGTELLPALENWQWLGKTPPTLRGEPQLLLLYGAHHTPNVFSTQQKM